MIKWLLTFIIRLIVLTLRKLSSKAPPISSFYTSGFTRFFSLFRHCISLIMGGCSLYGEEAKITYEYLKSCCCCLITESGNTDQESSNGFLEFLHKFWNGLMKCFILFIMFLITIPLLVVWTYRIYCRGNAGEENPQGPLLPEEKERTSTKVEEHSSTRVKPNPSIKGKNNYLFYKNQLKSKPDGDFVDEIHRKWKGDYNRLERHHGYIQWLFPLYEKGLNYDSDPLNIEETEMMRGDDEIRTRLISSFELMLDFYGLELRTENDEAVVEHAENWAERYKNLNKHTHNCLRITRIIKCLRIFGLEDLATAMMKTLSADIIVRGRLPSCRRSAQDFWTTSLSDVSQVAVHSHIAAIQEGNIKGNPTSDKPITAAVNRQPSGEQRHSNEPQREAREYSKTDAGTSDYNKTGVSTADYSKTDVSTDINTSNNAEVDDLVVLSTTEDEQDISKNVPVAKPPDTVATSTQQDHSTSVLAESPHVSSVSPSQPGTGEGEHRTGQVADGSSLLGIGENIVQPALLDEPMDIDGDTEALRDMVIKK